MEKPFKELRFTRSRQAVTFVIAGAIFFGVAAGTLVLWWQRLEYRPAIWWALLPTIASWACFRLAVRLTRHAFLLLSPIGIEIFPFFRPAQNMQLFSWGAIKHAEVCPGQRLLVLTLAGYEDAKVIISLAPIKPGARSLLAKAITGVMEKRAEGADTIPQPPPG